MSDCWLQESVLLESDELQSQELADPESGAASCEKQEFPESRLVKPTLESATAEGDGSHWVTADELS